MIIGEYKIESDELNTTLSKRMITQKGDNEGKEYYHPIGYYSSFKAALKALTDLEVRLTELKDFKIVVAKQDELYKLIKSVV